MKTLTETILDDYSSSQFDHMLGLGAEHAVRHNHRPMLRFARQCYADVRRAYGFAHRHSAILTAPADNMKLDKGKVPTYGITLQHYVQRLSSGIVINACPNAGHCTKVCVLDNGMGRYNSVQLGRRAKTEFLAMHPSAFAFLLGYELGLAVKRDGAILLRPNVNSDVEWERVAPSLCEGQPTFLFGAVRLYGYSKLDYVLQTDGWLGQAYRVAFSANERTTLSHPDVQAFLGRGGSVAVVTDRKPKTSPSDWSYWPIIDADLTDEWIFQEGVIGDLSAKGKARSLIGKSGFIHLTPGTNYTAGVIAHVERGGLVSA